MKQYESLKHGTADFPVGIHDTVCDRGFSLYPHIHREFEFLVMSEGKGTIYIEEEKFELSAGEGIFINSEQLHIGIKTDNERAVFFAVVFAPEVFASEAVIKKFVEPVMCGKVKLTPALEKEELKLLEEIHENRENELKIRANLHLIWEKCLKRASMTENMHPGRSSEDIKRVMEYMRNNYADMITLDDIASYINVSRGYLCRRFANVVHMTPFEYLTEVRIDKSCDMLKGTDMTIGEIAQRCGFNSFSYFSKKFREKMGCTPKNYRN